MRRVHKKVPSPGVKFLRWESAFGQVKISLHLKHYVYTQKGTDLGAGGFLINDLSRAFKDCEVQCRGSVVISMGFFL